MKKLPFKISIKANADMDEPAEMSIRGVIGEEFDMETWSTKSTEDEVLNELSQIPKGKKIHVKINSPGGDVGIALGCYNAIASRYDDVTTQNCGYACSAASILRLAGKNRLSPTSCNWMIHCGSCMSYGNAEDHQKTLNMCNSIDKTMAAIYCKASGVGTPEEWLEKMKAETWFTGEEACEAGLGTSAEGDTDSPEIEMSAAAKKVIATFKHIPKNLQARFSVSATAGNPPPNNNQQTKKTSMKLIIAALVASGFPCAEDASEQTIATTLQSGFGSIKAERDGFKTQLDGVAATRKNRVTEAVEKAVTDKIVAEGRKASMIATGSATPEGETVILDQIVDLREAKASFRGRGANPVPRGNGNAEGDTIESLLEEQAEAISANNTEELAAINGRLAKARKREPLFETEPTYRRARN